MHEAFVSANISSKDIRVKHDASVALFFRYIPVAKQGQINHFPLKSDTM